MGVINVIIIVMITVTILYSGVTNSDIPVCLLILAGSRSSLAEEFSKTAVADTLVTLVLRIAIKNQYSVYCRINIYLDNRRQVQLISLDELRFYYSRPTTRGE